MAGESTVGALQVADLLAALGDLGLATPSLCDAVGLELRVLDDPAARVPARVLVDLFSEAERRIRDSSVGLHAGQRAEPRGVLAYLVMASARLDEGLRYVVRFSPLMIDTLRVDLEVSADRATLRYDLRDAALAQRHLVEYLLMATLRTLNRAAGRPLHVCEIRVQHGDAGDGDEAARAFCCPVRFAQPDVRLALAATDLEVATRLANPLIAEQIEKFAAALLPRVAPPAALSERVAAVVRVLLAGGVRATRAAVARRLGMSDRTLERGLEDERTTFRAIRDAALWEVVEALLSNPALKVETVALNVGFANVAAFSKAFKRWAGCSATQYRERLITAQRRAT